MGIFMSVEEAIKEKIKEQKNAHVMLVEGMSKLWTHKVKMCQSSVFELAGHKWKLIVYPAGKNRTSNHVSLYLRIKDKKSLGSNGQVECCVKLLVVDNVLTKLCHSTTMYNVHFNAKQAIHGKDCFMKHAEFKKDHIRDDRVVFGVEITNVKSNCAVNFVPRSIGTAERLKLEDVPPNKSRFTWKINRFSSFKGKKHSSHEFTVGPRKWTLLMYPNGVDEGSRGHMSLCLAATDYLTKGPKAKTLAVRQLRVLDQINRNHLVTGDKYWNDFWYHYDTNHNSSFAGPYKFLPLDQLNDLSKGYLVQDEIYLGVEFLLVSTTEYL